VISEEFLDLILIFLDDLIPLSLELFLDLLELLLIIGSHIKELLTHSFNQIIDVIILLFERFNIFFILLLKLVHELLDQVILLGDDLLAGLLLHLDILCELFAIFFLLELLPSPINLDIFLVTCDDLSLDLVCSFLSQFLLLDTSCVFGGIGVRPNLGDDLGCFTLDLL
jgi:hypothetical protein